MGISARPVFVGRSEVLEELAAAVRRADAGHGGVVLVCGEAGAGKTRLVHRAVEGLPPHVTVGWSRARESGSPPLWVWTQLARQLRRHGVDLPPTATHGTPDRFELFDSVATALVEGSELHPMVLVVDDLQWADPDSLELLGFLAADLPRSRVAVLAVVRTGEGLRDREVRHRLAGTHPQTVELTGLEGDELAALVDAVAGAPPPPAVLTALRRHTGGNPLFVTELARLMRATGRLDDAAAWWGVLPDGVRAVLGRRLARLPERSHRLLARAAVLGVEFDTAILSDLVEADREEVLSLLDPAREAGLVVPQDDGRYAFGHALIRDTASDELPGPDRRALHRRAARLLAATAEQAAGEIAEHHWAAGDTTDAVRWSVLAGRQAAAEAMYADATDWFLRALRSRREGLDGLQRIEVLLCLGDVAARCTQFTVADDAFTEAVEEARRTGTAEQFARAVRGFGSVGGGFEVRVLDPRQVALLDEALEALPDADSPTRAQLLARLSIALSIADTSGRRVRSADEAVAMARRLGDPAAIAEALAAWCDSRAGPAHLEQRLTVTDEQLHQALLAGDREQELLARRHRIVALLERGDVAAATVEVRAFAALADRLRQPQFRWYARLMEGMLAHLAGDLEVAEQRCATASALGRAAGSGNAHLIVDGGLWPIVRRDRGDMSGFLEMFRSVNAGHPEASRGVDPTPFIALSAAPAVPPDTAALRRVLDLVPERGPVPPDDAIHLFTCCMFGWGAAIAGDPSRAALLTNPLRPYADHFVLDGHGAACYGPVAGFLGRIEAANGNHDQARTWFSRALDLLAPVEAPLLVASLRQALDALPSGADEPTAVTRFRREEGLWWLAYDGVQARFLDAKGLRDVAVLLAEPGREFHVLDLVGADRRLSPAGAADTLDPQARRAYENRIRDLGDELQEAEDHHDLARADRLTAERDALLDQLVAAFGLGGRARRLGTDPAERARKAVGMRIRAAVDRIDREMPALARHLRASVRTGMYCSYQPERDVDWQL